MSCSAHNQTNQKDSSSLWMQRFFVNTEVHMANLNEIKFMMQMGTKEIETIFKGRVNEMKEIHEDARKTLVALSALKEKVSPEVFAEIDDSWNMTQSILVRTDEVIKAMYGFVSALQCEDRMSQMIDGITKIMDKDIRGVVADDIFIDSEVADTIKKELVQYYTIQEQRDYAMGVSDAFSQSCDIKDEASKDLDEFTLF